MYRMWDMRWDVWDVWGVPLRKTTRTEGHEGLALQDVVRVRFGV